MKRNFLQTCSLLTDHLMIHETTSSYVTLTQHQHLPENLPPILPQSSCIHSLAVMLEAIDVLTLGRAAFGQNTMMVYDKVDE